ncbi:MAG: hypothetical protein M3114_00530 [Thermoproteota archaeon]|nr:hypothetical protein [Thermoproteota archaeon]
MNQRTPQKGGYRGKLRSEKPSGIEEKCERVQGVDTEALKLDIQNQREQDSHGCPA